MGGPSGERPWILTFPAPDPVPGPWRRRARRSGPVRGNVAFGIFLPRGEASPGIAMAGAAMGAGRADAETVHAGWTCRRNGIRSPDPATQELKEEPT